MKLLFSTSLLSLFALAFFISSCGSDLEPPCTEFIWYTDEDGDGFGDLTNPIKNCDSIPPSGFAELPGDLDDTQSGITTVSNREKFNQLMASFNTQDTFVLNYIHSTDFVQHNATLEDGKAGIVKFYLENQDTATVSIKRVFTDSDGDIFIAHSVYEGKWNGGQPQVIFDVYRFKNGSIVEHWDNIVDEEDDGDIFTQTSGPKSVNPSESANTDANRNLIKNMAADLFINGDADRYSEYFDPIPEYYQHSLETDLLVSKFQTLVEASNGQGIYDEVKFVYAEGDFVLLMSQGPNITDLSDAKDYAYFDLFRLFNNRIVEHWEVKQEILPSDQANNNNGKW